METKKREFDTNLGPFELGHWLIDPGLNWMQHQKDGRKIQLEPKAMELLVALARRPGETVSKEELLEEVWKGVLVVDTVVPKTISSLRQALGDDIKDPEFIRTVQRKGYRLIAPIRPFSGSVRERGSASGTSPKTELKAPKPRSPLLKGRLLFILTGTFALLLALWVSGSNHSKIPLEEPILTLAVGPFTNGSTVGTGEGLTVAIRSEILTELARFDSPRVFPIGTRPGEPESPLTIAREIQVDALLEGQVFDLGDQIRIDLRLIETETGKQRWSTSVERPTEELWSFRRQVATALIDRLEVQVPQSGHPSNLVASSPVSQDVYRLYLEARYLWTRRTTDGLRRAHALFSEVTERAPILRRVLLGWPLSK